VAQQREALMGLAGSGGHLRSRTGPKDADLRAARVCYNPLAGEAGIQLYDSLIGRGFPVFTPGGLTLGAAGWALFDAAFPRTDCNRGTIWPG